MSATSLKNVLRTIPLMFLAASTWATQDPNDVYQPPVRTKNVELRYPTVEAGYSREGWVSLHFMVNKEGKPYQIAVTDSVGGKRFEDEAIKALENSSFAPATLHGQPVDAYGRASYRFSMDSEARAARRSFVNQWRKVEKNINANNREAAVRLMQALTPTNPYEEGYYQLSRALFALKWGTREEVKMAAQHAIVPAEISEGEKYLPESATQAVEHILMAAQMETHDYYGAWETACKLQKNQKDPARWQQLQDVIDKVLKIKDEPGSYDVKGAIDNDSNWSIVLFKNRFSISLQSGRLTALRLYCPTRYDRMRFDESLEYTADAEHGYCRLAVVGDPNSTFVLTQR